VAAATGAVMIGLGRTFWHSALSIEVYSLHLLLVSLILWFFVTSLLDDGLSAADQRRRWLLFALVLGFSFANHMTTVFLLPGLALLALARGGGPAALARKLAVAAPVFALGLSPYLYLPLRAAARPWLNWGNPSSAEGFLWHVSGRQYSTWMFSGLEVCSRQLKLFIAAMPSELSVLGLALLPFGVVISLRRQRWLGLCLLLLFITCLGLSVNYDIADIESYFLLAWVVAGIWVTHAVDALYGRLRLRRWRSLLGCGVAVLITLIASSGPAVSERGNHLVEDYTSNMLQSMTRNALVISYQWDYWVSAAYHYQLVEGLRTDVVIIEKELLRRSWYLEQLRHNYPQVMARSEAEVDRFAAELVKFEHRQPYRAETIERRFNEMIDSFVHHNYDHRPIYLTAEIENHLASGYLRVPEGLALRLYRRQDLPSPHAAVWDDFAYRPFGRRGRLIDGLNGMYAQMLLNRAIYLHHHRLFEASDGYLRRARRFADSAELGHWQERNRRARKGSGGGAGQG
jgi:hypothetical protein